MESSARMLRAKPADQWERFGRDDPYYGVYASEEFLGQELDAERRARFFASGEDLVDSVYREIREVLDPAFAPRRVLDYGCGVGRLLIPFAERAEHVVGVDVSPSMRAEARRNCDAAGLTNLELIAPETFHRLTTEFEFVHSALVLQHMPVREGERVIGRLAALLPSGGIGSLHLQIGGQRRHIAYNGLMKVPVAHNLVNVVRGRSWSRPHMQMNVYDLSRLVLILRSRGISTVHLRVAEREGGFDACTLCFRR